MFQPPPRMSKLPSVTLAASASSMVTLIRRSIAGPGALARRAGRSSRAAGASDQPWVTALEVHRVDADRVMDAARRVVLVGGEPAEPHTQRRRHAGARRRARRGPACRASVLSRDDAPPLPGALRRAVIHGAPSYRISGSGWAGGGSTTR